MSVIRVLAGGALSGSAVRHPLASPAPVLIGSGSDYGSDVQHAHRFNAFVDAGHVQTLVGASLRFPSSASPVSTGVLGASTIEHLEWAMTSMDQGLLAPEACSQ